MLEAARGFRQHRLSYYDAQIWATARLNQVPTVFTEDFQDGQRLEGVRFVNPLVAGFELAPGRDDTRVRTLDRSGRRRAQSP